MTFIKKTPFTKFCQIVYLSFSFYFQNNLDASASACTFGFIFSFIPILIMVISIFTGLLHASPVVISYINNFLDQYTDVFDAEKVMGWISNGKQISLMNIFLGLWVIWMARKLFGSIIQGLLRIFRTQAPSRPVKNQLLSFAGEILIVIVFSAFFMAVFASRQIVSEGIFHGLEKFIPKFFSGFFVSFLFYLVIFITTLFAYKFASGTKPEFRFCFLTAFLCTLTFWICIVIVSHTLNTRNYKSVYGVLSNIMILLFEVYIFFVLFMFYAQMLYSIQFMRALLLSELYLLPHEESRSFWDSMRRLLFVTSSSLMTQNNYFSLKENETVFTEGDDADSVFYVAEGRIKILRKDTELIYEKGNFFGEFEYLMETKRQGKAAALEDSVIVKISDEEFSDLLKKTPQAAEKAIRKLPLHYKSS